MSADNPEPPKDAAPVPVEQKTTENGAPPAEPPKPAEQLSAEPAKVDLQKPEEASKAAEPPKETTEPKKEEVKAPPPKLLIPLSNCEPFLFRFVSAKKLYIQPLDVFNISLRIVTSDFNLQKHATAVVVKNTIFLTGGKGAQNKAMKTFSAVCLDFPAIENPTLGKPPCSIMTLADMNFAKYCHGAGVLKTADIAVVGGFYDENKETVNCSRFDFEQNKWCEMAALPKAFASIGVESVNGEFLYTFGGGNNSDSASIAILKYYLDGDYWDSIYLEENQDWTGSRAANAIQIDEYRFIIFGGESKLGLTRTSYIYDDFDKTMKKACAMGDDLPAQPLLPVCKAKYDDKAYCVYRDKCQIYDIKNNQWSQILFELS